MTKQNTQLLIIFFIFVPNKVSVVKAQQGGGGCTDSSQCPSDPTCTSFCASRGEGVSSNSAKCVDSSCTTSCVCGCSSGGGKDGSCNSTKNFTITTANIGWTRNSPTSATITWGPNTKAAVLGLLSLHLTNLQVCLIDASISCMYNPCTCSPRRGL